MVGMDTQRKFVLVLTLSMLLFGNGCKASFSGDNTEGSFNDSSDNSIDNSITEIIDDDLENGEADCAGEVLGVDGPGGFLWKPESDSDGNLVILFPPEYGVEFIAVYVETLAGETEGGVFAGFSNPNRQTWRFSLPGEAYTGRVRVDLGTQECLWNVSQPGNTQD